MTASGASAVDEGAKATFTITVEFAGPVETEHVIDVPWQIEHITTEDSDYSPKSGIAKVTIPATEAKGSANIEIDATDDAVDEDPENFRLSADGATAPPTTINDGDADPPASIAGDGTLGEEGGTRTLTVTLAAASEKAVDVPYVVGGTAASGDFTTSVGSPIRFAAGVTSAPLTITGTPDGSDESNETVEVSVGNTKATATIVDDDEPLVASVEPVTVPEGNAGHTINVPVKLDRATDAPLEITYSTFDGTAKAGEDYVKADNKKAILSAGATEGLLPIDVLGDTNHEVDETFTVVANAPGQSGTRSAVVALTNDEPIPALTVEPAAVAEGAEAKLVFRIKLSARAGQNVTVNWATADGSAVGAVDYQVRSGFLTFESGPDKPLEHLVEVPVLDDTLDELPEQMVVRLSQPTIATVAVGEAVGTINDNDNTSAVAADDATADELETGTSTMAFKLRLQPASARPVTANWSAVAGTAAVGADFQPVSGAVRFAPGETEKTVEVTIIGDTVNEPNETFTLQIGTVAGARKAQGGDGMGTIIDKSAPPSLSISDGFGRESEGVAFTVTLAGNTTRPVSVHFATADGTARAGADYAARNGTLTFAPGEKTKVLEVTIHDDTAPENEETVNMTITDPVNGAITKGLGVGRIEANDPVSATPRGSNGPTPRGPTVPTSNRGPRLSFAPKTIVATKAGIIRFQVTCSKLSTANGCRGSAFLDEVIPKPKTRATTAAKARKPKRFGAKAFRLRAGQRATVGVKLTKAAFALLKRKKVLKARLTVHVRDGTKTIKASPGIVTLRLKPARPSTDVVVNR